MSPELIIHKSTKSALDSYLSHPAQAVALIGAEGSGKTTLALSLVSAMLKIDFQAAANRGLALELKPEENKDEISIELVRKLIAKLSLKAAEAGQKRVVLITDANKMGDEAQNALLKTIEEPPADTYFILTIPTLKSIAPTIASRLEKITVHPVSLDQALSDYAETYSEKDIRTAWQLSKGLSGMLHSLLKNEAEDLKGSIEDAKKFLRLNRYERILFLESVAKDRKSLANFLSGLSKVLEAVNHSMIAKDDANQAKRVVGARGQLMQLRAMLLANTSPKLITLQIVNGLKV